jgi:hypothetical protein
MKEKREKSLLTASINYTRTRIEPSDQGIFFLRESSTVITAEVGGIVMNRLNTFCCCMAHKKKLFKKQKKQNKHETFCDSRTVRGAKLLDKHF